MQGCKVSGTYGAPFCKGAKALERNTATPKRTGQEGVAVHWPSGVSQSRFITEPSHPARGPGKAGINDACIRQSDKKHSADCEDVRRRQPSDNACRLVCANAHGQGAILVLVLMARGPLSGSRRRSWVQNKQLLSSTPLSTRTHVPGMPSAAVAHGFHQAPAHQVRGSRGEGAVDRHEDAIAHGGEPGNLACTREQQVWRVKRVKSWKVHDHALAHSRMTKESRPVDSSLRGMHRAIPAVRPGGTKTPRGSTDLQLAASGPRTTSTQSQLPK